MNDQARALLTVVALWSGALGSASFVGGRISVSAPPAEVRYVPIFAPVVQLPAEPVPIEPVAPVESAPVAPIEPPAAPPAVETKPLPPKVDVKPKPPIKPQAKPRAPALKKSLPSCAVVQREYNAMTGSQRWARFLRSTTEEIAYGRQCLGL